MRLPSRTLSTKILGGQVIVLLVAGAIGFAFSKRGVRQLVDHQYEQRALAIAETTATMPSIRAALADGDAHRTVQGLAQQVMARTGASYVVVIDRHQIRHSHPIPALIGQPVAEPLVALDGRGHVGIDPGNLGRSANGKAPIFASNGTVIGEVSAGLLENRVSSEAAGQLPSLAAYALVALAGGIVVASVLARRLKRQTFGLELDEIAALLQDREATLHGIREGVVALDRAGRVSLINDQAHLLLHTPPNTVGRPVGDLFPAGRLLDLLAGGGSGHDQVVLFGDRLLVVNRMPVTRRGKDLGTVVTLRDRTELEAALRELDDVRGFTDALRAQQHEFSNRMHVIAGLLELGRYQEAESFVSEVSGATAGLAAELETRISSPRVVALLVAKTTVAIERGVNLTITGESRLEVDQDQANALVSIIGNLVDNAIDAAAGHPGRGSPIGPLAVVTVRFLQDSQHSVVEVADTGPGIPPGAREFIFTDGWSTKAAPGDRPRGLGLALVRQIAERLGGDINIAEGSGAVLRVTLPRRPVAVSR
jgi:two-component system, CitB family, sensor kinase